ncbi:cupin domain-containing protein [Candidatus Aerophobetes bacterium]|nr:cupin domain-containing protein [Candidatus Aerophobetes bacterium]
MGNQGLKVVKKKECIKMDIFGDGVARFYVEEKDMIMGTFTVPPGKKGSVDPGHPRTEIFYVVKGDMIVSLPEEKVCVEAEEGDTVLIPPNKPHQVINIGEGNLTIVFMYPL